MRALASHQCGPGSTPGPGVICGLSLLLVLVFAPRGFSPVTPVVHSPQKPTFPNSNSILDPRATGLSVPDCCVSPSLNKVDLFIYLLIPLISSNLQILLRTVGKDFYTGFCRLHSAFYVLQNTSTCTLPSIEVPKCHGCSYLRL